MYIGALKAVWRGIVFTVEEVIPTATLALTVIAIIIQVFFRYVLNQPLTWPFELSIYAFVWTLYLGAAYATRLDEHVRLDVVYVRMPEKLRAVLDIVFHLLTNVVFLVALGPIWDYLEFSYRIKTVALKLPWTYVFLAFPIFLVLVVLHNFGYIFHDIRVLLGKAQSESSSFRE